MPPLLEVTNLKIRYGAPEAGQPIAVDGVRFDIGAGEVVGLMGESGCGKTSIALAILGLLTYGRAHTSGSILWRGKDLLVLPANEMRKLRGAEISMVFQEPEQALSPVLRIVDQVAEVIHAHSKLNWKECRAESRRMLERVGLPATPRIFAAYPHQLSGGQRQRVVLAQALACKPALIVADEPTASLDSRSQNELLALLRNLKRETGLAILLISHAAEVQAYLADRLIVMEHGKIVEQGTFEQMYRKPAHPLTRTMLRAAAATVSQNLDYEMVT
ncbi:MAG TPA: ABC transporter ATP-binding protein [Candidatus Acidoferrales bacterium]